MWSSIVEIEYRVTTAVKILMQLCSTGLSTDRAVQRNQDALRLLGMLNIIMELITCMAKCITAGIEDQPETEIRRKAAASACTLCYMLIEKCCDHNSVNKTELLPHVLIMQVCVPIQELCLLRQSLHAHRFSLSLWSHICVVFVWQISLLSQLVAMSLPQTLMLGPRPHTSHHVLESSDLRISGRSHHRARERSQHRAREVL